MLLAGRRVRASAIPRTARQDSDRPEQTAWWEQTVALFTGEPVFRNSTPVEADTPGDPFTGRLRAGHAGSHASVRLCPMSKNSATMWPCPATHAPAWSRCRARDVTGSW